MFVLQSYQTWLYLLSLRRSFSLSLLHRPVVETNLFFAFNQRSLLPRREISSPQERTHGEVEGREKNGDLKQIRDGSLLGRAHGVRREKIGGK